MAVGFATAVGNAMLDSQIPNTWYIQMHVGDPGPNGTANRAVNTTRKLIPFAAAVNCINSQCLPTKSGSADFSHTAQLSLILPEGFTFTSDSGVFLSSVNTQPGSSVPEPPTYALLLAGLVLLGFSARRGKYIEAI